MKRVSSGEKFKPSASEWNAFVDAADRNAQRQGNNDELDRRAEALIGYVKNTTEADLVPGDVLGIGDPLIDFDAAATEIGETIAVEGVLPDVDLHVGRFCVLLEALAPDAIGLAAFDGYVRANVDVIDEGHRYADVVDGATRLESRDGGGARIIQVKSGTGDRLAYVQLAPYIAPQVVTLTYNLYYNATTEAELEGGRAVRVRCRLLKTGKGLAAGLRAEAFPLASANEWILIGVDDCVKASTALDEEDDEPEEE